MLNYIEFYKRFANGDQYIHLNPITQEIQQKIKELKGEK